MDWKFEKVGDVGGNFDVMVTVYSYYELSGKDTKAVVEAYASNGSGKISAIKKFREILKAGLGDSKNCVEAMIDFGIMNDTVWFKDYGSVKMSMEPKLTFDLGETTRFVIPHWIVMSAWDEWMKGEDGTGLLADATMGALDVEGAKALLIWMDEYGDRLPYFRTVP